MKPLLCALILGCLSQTVNVQTIADLARQERAKRQSQTKAAVITTPMIRSTPAKPTETLTEPVVETKKETVNPKPETPGAEAAAPKQTAATETRDEKWWRSQFETARGDVKSAENRVAVLENELKTVNREFLQRSFDPDNSGPRAIADTTARLDAAKKELDEARNKISQLEEEMRRTGAPPGWAR